jgi:hypothetical protein
MAITHVDLNFYLSLPRPSARTGQDELQVRMNTVIQKIRTFESRLGKVNPCDIRIGEFEESAYADPSRNYMIIPSWFLIKHEDIPARFHVTSLDDPRLNDTQFLIDMAAWMGGKIKELGVSLKDTSTSNDALKFVIRLMRDREGFEQAKEFALAHEASHLSHGLETRCKIQEIVANIPRASLILTTVISLVLFPFVPFAIVAGAGSAICLTAVAGYFIFNKCQAPFWVEEEKKADLDGVKALQGNARGGVYFFDTMRLHQLEVQKEALSQIANLDEQGRWVVGFPTMSFWEPVKSIKNCIDWYNNMLKTFNVSQDGNNFGDTLHPPLTERIAYLRNLGQRALDVPLFEAVMQP